jgi:hypothetical protein
MRLPLLMTIGLAAAGWSAPAQAQTDFLTAAKIACAPERMTRCKEPGVECVTREAGERDKAQLLVLDFAGKKALLSRDGEERPFGDVMEDRVDGAVRRIVVARPQNPQETLSLTLRKDGKMDGVRDSGRIKMEVTCKPA